VKLQHGTPGAPVVGTVRILAAAAARSIVGRERAAFLTTGDAARAASLKNRSPRASDDSDAPSKKGFLP
jgi:hypothetical protein